MQDARKGLDEEKIRIVLTQEAVEMKKAFIITKVLSTHLWEVLSADGMKGNCRLECQRGEIWVTSEGSKRISHSWQGRI